jgi:hypothetical protein
LPLHYSAMSCNSFPILCLSLLCFSNAVPLHALYYSAIPQRSITKLEDLCKNQ